MAISEDEDTLDGYYTEYDAHKWVARLTIAHTMGHQIRLGIICKECLKVISMAGMLKESNCQCGYEADQLDIITSHGLQEYAHRFQVTTSSREQREDTARSRI